MSNDVRSEVDDVYSNSNYCDSDSETESVFDPDEYARKTLDEMETKMNTMTNRFVHRVKSEVDETFSKLRLQQKLKEKSKPKNPRQEEKVNKMPERGCGEPLKSRAEDDTFNLLQRKKMRAYGIINENIKVLQQVDKLEGKLYRNHLAGTRKN